MKLARILVFLPLAVLFLAPVQATTPVLVTGSLTGIAATGTVSDVRTADGNAFFTVVQQTQFAGGINGQGTFTFSVLLKETTLATFTADGMFTGTVHGSSTGTAEMHVTGTATLVGTVATNLQGQMTLGSGTQGLEGLHGHGTLLQTGPNTVSYSVQVHFDPA